MHGIFTQEVWEIEKLSHTLIEQIDGACIYYLMGEKAIWLDIA